MNKARSEKLAKLAGELDDIKLQIETLRDAEQEYYDNLSESQQESEKGETSNTAIEEMESVIESLETATNSLNEAAHIE